MSCLCKSSQSEMYQIINSGLNAMIETPRQNYSQKKYKSCSNARCKEFEKTLLKLDSYFSSEKTNHEKMLRKINVVIDYINSISKNSRPPKLDLTKLREKNDNDTETNFHDILSDSFKSPIEDIADNSSTFKFDKNNSSPVIFPDTSGTFSELSDNIPIKDITSPSATASDKTNPISEQNTVVPPAKPRAELEFQRPKFPILNQNSAQPSSPLGTPSVQYKQHFQYPPIYPYYTTQHYTNNYCYCQKCQQYKTMENTQTQTQTTGECYNNWNIPNSSVWSARLGGVMQYPSAVYNNTADYFKKFYYSNFY